MLGDPHPVLGAAEDLGNKGGVESADDTEEHHFGLVVGEHRGDECDSLLSGQAVDGFDVYEALGRKSPRSTRPPWGRCSAASTGESPR